MKYLSLALVVALPALIFIGCGKEKVKAVKPVSATEQTAERVSGPLPATIAWELDVDGK